MKRFLVFVCLVRFTFGEFSESVIQDGASGSEVVERVIDLVSSTCMIDNELFLRRMAYVETTDGTDARTYRAGYNGGIWNVDETMFKATQNRSSLLVPYDEIKKTLNIDWSTVQWKDLRKPLYSAVATALYLLSRNIIHIPETIEKQATIWHIVRPQNAASTFYLKTLSLNTQCPVGKELDVVIILDFSSMTPLEMVNIHTFIRNIINGSGVSNGAIRFGIVTKHGQPLGAWFLNSNRPGISILQALPALTYYSGPTATAASLEFARAQMFTTIRGARPGSAKVALLLTDGITHYTTAESEVKTLNAQGIQVMVVEVDSTGRATSRMNLNNLVDQPKCRNARIVNRFTDLTGTVEEMLSSVCKAPAILPVGDYTYTCGTPLTTKLPDSTLSASVQISQVTGHVDLYAAKAYLVPDQSSSDVHLTANSTYSPALFVRGTDPMYIRIDSTACTGTYMVHVKTREEFKGSDGVCVIAGTVRSCNSADMSSALHDTVLVSDPDFPYVCNTQSHAVEYFPHPVDPHKFVMCDQHETQFIGLCPVSQPSCTQTSSGCIYTNPCSPSSIMTNNRFHADPCASPDLYITCTQFGIAEVNRCLHNRLWNQDSKHCVYPFVHDPFTGKDNPAIRNPCIHSHEDHVYFPFPNQPSKYIFCDINGNAFQRSCHGNAIWNQQTTSCTSVTPAVPAIG